MSEVVSWLFLASAVFAAGATVGGGILWLFKPRVEDAVEKIIDLKLAPFKVQLDDLHRMVTQNGHKSETPTIRDELADIKKLLEDRA